ncbi:hypothetical protein HDE_09629 [Halotydeus destructor]|nr:hypothetical protein HDE_09629 [Halotydeus destructor]
MTKPEAFTAGKTETALAWTQRCTHICFRVSQYLAIYPEMAACEQFDTSFHSVMQNVNLAIKEWAYHRLDLAHDILVTQVPKDHLYGQMAQSVLFTIDALLGTMSDQKFQVAANSLWSTIQASNSKRVTTPWLGQVKPTDYTEGKTFEH